MASTGVAPFRYRDKQIELYGDVVEIGDAFVSHVFIVKMKVDGNLARSDLGRLLQIGIQVVGNDTIQVVEQLVLAAR
ncbi:hypothetical protein D3C78_1310490 [compost metagenome]